MIVLLKAGISAEEQSRLYLTVQSKDILIKESRILIEFTEFSFLRNSPDQGEIMLMQSHFHHLSQQIMNSVKILDSQIPPNALSYPQDRGSTEVCII